MGSVKTDYVRPKKIENPTRGAREEGDQLKFLLYNYYIDYSKREKFPLIILCLLHELRVVSLRQLLAFIQNENLATERTVYNILKLLRDQELVERSKNGKTSYYYLTKAGHNYIGGYYTLPKIPEYNLDHHLQINDYILRMCRLCKNHPHLKAVISERRRVFEVKDQAMNKKGVKYFVPDFIFMFEDQKKREVEWQFEIELTLKTKRRYQNGIFPKYIKQLEKYEDTRLIYVTPSPVIKDELDLFKDFFVYQKGQEYAEIFDRLHVFSAEEFEGQMKLLIEQDKFINW